MRGSAERHVVLLGPQRKKQSVATAVAELGITGPLAIVTAGWEEREREDAGLSRDLGGRTRNLGLYPRADDIFDGDNTVRSLMHERQDRLRQLQGLYRLRLAPQLLVCRTLLARTDPGEPDTLHGPEIESAIAGIRALDEHHLGRTAALETEIEERLADRRQPAMERHLSELIELLDGTEALLIAGGNVGTLLTLLRLFDVLALTADKPIVAWSGGAMVISERVVLFHDSPPQGPGDVEIYGPGLGLVKGVIALPHARHRLQLDDRGRVALLARRFSPATCIALDYGGRIDRGRSAAGWRPGGEASVLGPDGRVTGSIDAPDRPGRAKRSGRPGPGWSPSSGSKSDVTVRTTPSGDNSVRLAGSAGTRRGTGGAEAVVEKLAAGARGGPRAIDQVLATLRFPVVGDGWALFVYRGRADDVRLHQWVSGLPSAQPFQPVEGTDLWVLETPIQDRARIEYKLEIVKGDQRELIRDPLNETMARDPFGANSVVQGIGYTKPTWTDEQPSARRGRIIERTVASAAFGQDRPYSVYLPARFRDTRRYPLLVVHDGLDYVQYASLVTVLDNLIHRLEIPPLVAALIQSPERNTEYGADERHVRFLVDELVPALEETLPMLHDPRDRGLLGASLGGVAGLHTAWSRQQTFGKLLLQSGSFAFTDIGDHDLGPVFDPVVQFVNRFRKDPGRPADRIFLSAGIYESLIYFNRSLLPVLQSTGAEVRLVEAQDGHNWENWRDQLREGLTWLFPGPLSMVYE